jgi:hypothetical protein
VSAKHGSRSTFRRLLTSAALLPVLPLLALACEGSNPPQPPPAGGSGGAAAGSGGRAGGGAGGSSAGAGGAAGDPGTGGSIGGAGGGGAGGGGPGTGGAAAAGGSSPVPDGGGNASDGPAGADGPAPAGEVVVQGFDGVHVYFAGMDNKRRQEADVAFPAAGPWGKVQLRLRLRCPSGRCDFWDRWAYLGLVNGQGAEAPITEIMRFVTPYRLTADWTADVTALAPMLAGKQRLAVMIDTWVGPGHAQGNGWLVDVSFTFTPAPAPAERTPAAVIPLWDVGSVEVGDPAKPVAGTVKPRTVMIPADAKAVELRAFITGHGQGNLQNCAEFCPKTHRYTVAGTAFERRIWRDDCRTTAVQNQPGTWTLARAGWCPGALVTPWTADVTAAAKAGTSIEIAYSPEPYVNSCRPGAAPCAGCALATGCAYDNGNHTPPNYLQSALLVVYR